MTDVRLDTTALIDLEFRSPKLRDHILALVPASRTLHTSRYVVFELARGFLPRLIRLYNKAAQVSSLSDLLQYINNCGVGSRRVMSTMINAYTDYLRKEEELGIALTASQQLAKFRGWLSRLIRRGWRAVARYTLHNPIGCQDSLSSPVARRIDAAASPVELYQHDLPDKLCGKVGNCRLIENLQSSASAFPQILDYLRDIPKPDEETSRRVAGMERLLPHDPVRDFEAKDCYDCGDAIIAHEAPDHHCVLSKNKKHYKPLCECLGKKLLCYTEPKPDLTT